MGITQLSRARLRSEDPERKKSFLSLSKRQSRRRNRRGLYLTSPTFFSLSSGRSGFRSRRSVIHSLNNSCTSYPATPVPDRRGPQQRGREAAWLYVTSKRKARAHSTRPSSSCSISPDRPPSVHKGRLGEGLYAIMGMWGRGGKTEICHDRRPSRAIRRKKTKSAILYTRPLCTIYSGSGTVVGTLCLQTWASNEAGQRRPRDITWVREKVLSRGGLGNLRKTGRREEGRGRSAYSSRRTERMGCDFVSSRVGG